MNILYWTPIAKAIKDNLTTRVAANLSSDHYIVILWYGDNPASAKYVHMKQKFWLDVGIDTKLIGQWSTPDLSEVINTIQQYNQDPYCLGIMCQLPLPAPLSNHKVQILETIDPSKDIDGLTWAANGKTIRGASQLYPATVASILGIIDHYGYGEMKSKIVTIINKSNLIGKPLAMALVDRGAQVTLIGRWSSIERVKSQCQQSDILITATGKGHMITRDFTNPNQIIVDAGVDFIDGKLVGDVDRDAIDWYIAGCTPPTWGVWPMTVACLFDNVRVLNS